MDGQQSHSSFFSPPLADTLRLLSLDGQNLHTKMATSSPSKEYYYVVTNGRAGAIFSSWKECLPHICSFPLAKIRCFQDCHEAQLYLENKMGVSSGANTGRAREKHCTHEIIDLVSDSSFTSSDEIPSLNVRLPLSLVYLNVNPYSNQQQQQRPEFRDPCQSKHDAHPRPNVMQSMVQYSDQLGRVTDNYFVRLPPPVTVPMTTTSDSVTMRSAMTGLTIASTQTAENNHNNSTPCSDIMVSRRITMDKDHVKQIGLKGLELFYCTILRTFVQVYAESHICVEKSATVWANLCALAALQGQEQPFCYSSSSGAGGSSSFHCRASGSTTGSCQPFETKS
jgi:Caulimovirus viroplasmin